MANGSIVRLTDRGFGFIKQDDGTELFFHRSQVANNGFDSLREGQNVTYEKGKSARNDRDEAQKVAPV